MPVIIHATKIAVRAALDGQLGVLRAAGLAEWEWTRRLQGCWEAMDGKIRDRAPEPLTERSAGPHLIPGGA